MFYELVQCKDQSVLDTLQLMGDFSCLEDDGSNNSEDAANSFYKTDLKSTLRSMKLFFDQDTIDEILRILAGILHFSNLKSIPKNTNAGGNNGSNVALEEVYEIANLDVLRVGCELWGLDWKEMQTTLLTQNVSNTKERVYRNRNQFQIHSTIENYMKHLYSKLFDYMVSHINKTLGVDVPISVLGGSDSSSSVSVAMLDIFGFECFETNSLEQFLINYANEKLFSQFLHQVIELEALEYKLQGLENIVSSSYDTVLLSSNKDVISFIESKLFPLIDDQILVNGDDKTFSAKVGALYR